MNLRSIIFKLVSITISVCWISACSNSTYQAQGNAGYLNQGQAKDNLTRTGEISAEELITRYSKFARQYKNYQVDPLDSVKFARLSNMEIWVFFGLWCHDSQREVPRLLKTIEKNGISFDKLRLIAVNTKKEIPQAFQSRFSIEKTPTIFVVNKGEIVATMEERPKVSIAKDLLEQVFR
ncbi:thioredoxin family protein [Aliikangiella sp. G2MR2-5]|uniref:thioredoxin family protein n=1 Tax=Aliikangiella sp. G2MR2-5 TaxID=2788943 RepID=UPI0018A92DF8|nr:thioredoxin family protein [Aliikangiella sp. G2MR2-5]